MLVRSLLVVALILPAGLVPAVSHAADTSHSQVPIHGYEPGQRIHKAMPGTQIRAGLKRVKGALKWLSPKHWAATLKKRSDAALDKHLRRSVEAAFTNNAPVFGQTYVGERIFSQGEYL